MLSKKERSVMLYLYNRCKDKSAVLISPQEIINGIMPKFEINGIEVDQIINALVLDEYIDVVNSDNKGKLVYCVSLKAKGEAYLRETKSTKKTAYWLITRTVLLAILSFIVGVVLKAIFS